MAQQGGSPATGGYPYQIRAFDLDRNFVFATLQLHESLFVTTTGPSGHTARELKIPAVPSGDTIKQLTANNGSLEWKTTIPKQPATGTHVLGSIGGVLTWIATEEC
jgi:hypothetical protein